MSSPRPRLVLTKRAQRDERGIEVYTLHQWGPEQAAKYKSEIVAAFETVRDSPRIGRPRSDLGAGLFSYPTGHHILIYRIRANTIRIVRILHERTDPTRHL